MTSQQPLERLAARLDLSLTDKNSLTLEKPSGERSDLDPVLVKIAEMLGCIDPVLQRIAEMAARRDAALGGGAPQGYMPAINSMSFDKGTARTISPSLQAKTRWQHIWQSLSWFP